MEAIDVVRSSELFAGLPESDVRAVADMSVRREFARGESLFGQDEPSDVFYLIGSGAVEVGAKVGEDWVHYYSLAPGDAAGIVSFFARTEHRTTARASEPTVALMLGREALPRLRRMPALLLSIFKSRTQRMLKLVEIEEDLEGLSREEIQERAASLRRLVDDLEDQAAALHNEIHRAQIRLKLHESRLAQAEGRSA
jgi:CRP-like cAMP-binding protein